MNIDQVISFLAQEYPPAQAMDWDNPGLQVGHTDRPVQKIMVALDATLDVIRQCADWGADLLVTHHPLLLFGVRQVSDANVSGRRVLALAEHGIAHYAMHTNYDVTTMRELAAQKMGLLHTSVLEPTGTDAAGNEIGIGCIGELPEPISVGECCDLVKAAFGLSSVLLFGNPDEKTSAPCSPPCGLPETTGDNSDFRSAGDTAEQTAFCSAGDTAEQIVSRRAGDTAAQIVSRNTRDTAEQSLPCSPAQKGGSVRRIAVSPGSGKSMIAPAILAGADLLVTGDIGHHDGIDAADSGLMIIDAGHYGIEHIFVAQMQTLLQEKFPELDVRAAKQKSPFEVL